MDFKMDIKISPLGRAINLASRGSKQVALGSSALLLSAGMASNALAVTPIMEQQVAVHAQQSSLQTITIIDSALDDTDVLAASAPKGSSVYYLNNSEDGIEQISKILSQHKNVDSVHILSHGKPGYLALGSAILNQDSVGYYSQNLESWGQSLASGADILFYGCHAAEGTKGAQLLSEVAALTGADVAGSTDLTGHAQKGGDWDLEVRLGGITTASLDIQKYSHTMPVASDGKFIVGDGSGGGGGGAGYYQGDGAYAGNGGAGGGGNDTITGTAYADVIFGDGSGGGGAGYAEPTSGGEVGTGGAGGGGRDAIVGGAGNDILFGDGFDGQDGSLLVDNNGDDAGGFGGGGGLGGGGGGGGSNYSSGGYYATTGGQGGIGAGGGGGGDYHYGGDGGIGGGGGGSGGYYISAGGSGGGLGATDGGVANEDSGGGGGGGGFFGVGGTGSVYSGAAGGTGGNGGSSATGTGNGGNGCPGLADGDDGDYSGGAGGGAFGNADGGDAGCDEAAPVAERAGDDGQNGDTTQYSLDDTGGVVYSFVNGQLSTILTDFPNFGAGNDILDGGAGSDQLFGLGGNDTFVFKLADGSAGTDIDTVWDFATGDKLQCFDANGVKLDAAAITALVAAQTTPSGTDRQVILTDSVNTVTILLKDLDRDLVEDDFGSVPIPPAVVEEAKKSSSSGALSFIGMFGLLGLSTMRRRMRK